jgi:hypothetical protein
MWDSPYPSCNPAAIRSEYYLLALRSAAAEIPTASPPDQVVVSKKQEPRLLDGIYTSSEPMVAYVQVEGLSHLVVCVEKVLQPCGLVEVQSHLGMLL